MREKLGCDGIACDGVPAGRLTETPPARSGGPGIVRLTSSWDGPDAERFNRTRGPGIVRLTSCPRTARVSSMGPISSSPGRGVLPEKCPPGLSRRPPGNGLLEFALSISAGRLLETPPAFSRGPGIVRLTSCWIGSGAERWIRTGGPGMVRLTSGPKLARVVSVGPSTLCLGGVTSCPRHSPAPGLPPGNGP